MVIYQKGDIFHARTMALVNPVNCVGAMGAGLALAFAARYPEMETLYKQACKKKEVKIGTVFIYHTVDEYSQPRFIINLPTKIHWKDNSRIEYIDLGLMALRKTIFVHHLSSVALPMLGCGLGKLNPSAVKERIEKRLGNIPDCKIVVYR